MRANYRASQSTQFQLLSDDQLAELLQASLHVWEQVGMDVHHEETRQILTDSGAYVDGVRVRMPAVMIR